MVPVIGKTTYGEFAAPVPGSLFADLSDAPRASSVPRARALSKGGERRLLHRLCIDAEDLFRFMYARGRVDAGPSEPMDEEYESYSDVFKRRRSTFRNMCGSHVLDPETIWAHLHAFDSAPERLSAPWFEVCGSVAIVNLATLLQEVLTMPDDTNYRIAFLRTWECAFPVCVMPHLQDSLHEIPDIAEISLELRTQLYIYSLKVLSNRPSPAVWGPIPIDLLGLIFFASDQSYSINDTRAILHDPAGARVPRFRPLRALDPNEHDFTRNLFVARLEALGTVLPRDNGPYDLDLIEAKFPVSSLFQRLKTFSGQCFSTINQSLHNIKPIKNVEHASEPWGHASPPRQEETPVQHLRSPSAYSQRVPGIGL